MRKLLVSFRIIAALAVPVAAIPAQNASAATIRLTEEAAATTPFQAPQGFQCDLYGYPRWKYCAAAVVEPDHNIGIRVSSTYPEQWVDVCIRLKYASDNQPVPGDDLVCEMGLKPIDGTKFIRLNDTGQNVRAYVWIREHASPSGGTMGGTMSFRGYPTISGM